MLQPADPLDVAAMDAALASGQRRDFGHLLEIDWNRDGLFNHPLSDMSDAVESATLKREKNDATPGAAVTASGASAAELSLDLSGLINGVPVSELLAPYNADSELYTLGVIDTPVRYSIITRTSRGPITTRQFTGEIDQRRTHRSDDRVTLTCLDVTRRLRDAPARWPGYGVEGPAAARQNSAAPQRGVASSAIDHLCNSVGLRTRPRAPWESASNVLALADLPLHGSFAPTAGTMRSKIPWGAANYFPDSYTVSPENKPYNKEYWREDGPFGLAREADTYWYPGSLLYYPRDTPTTWTGRSTGIDGWFYCGPTVSGYGSDSSPTIHNPLVQVYFGYAITTNYYAYRLSITGNGPKIQVTAEIGTSTAYQFTYTPPSDAWRHVYVSFDHSAGPVRVRMVVDGTQVASFVPTGATNSYTPTALNPAFFPALGVRLAPGVPMSDVRAWQETGAPVAVPERTVTSAAVIDPSLNVITHLPVPNGNAWDVVAEISSAEFATAMADEYGNFRWFNRETVRSQDDPVITITLDDADEIGLTDAADGAANAALVTATAGEGTWETAYTMPTVDTIVATLGVSEHILPTDPTVIAVDSGSYPRLCQSVTSASTVPVWGAEVLSGWVFVYDSSLLEELTNQTMVDTQNQSGLDDGHLIRIMVNNTGTSFGRFRLKADTATGTDPQPALRIGGLVLHVFPPVDRTVTLPAAITAAGRTRTLALGDNPWRQDLDSVAVSAQFVLRRASQAIPVFDQVSVPADPRRQLTDRAVLLLGRSATRAVAYISGIVRTLDSDGLSEDLTVRVTHKPGAWALGDPELGQLESTAILG